MLKANISNERGVQIEIEGSILDILNDVGNLINSIHESLREDGDAVKFRGLLTAMISDDDSGVWGQRDGDAE